MELLLLAFFDKFARVVIRKMRGGQVQAPIQSRILPHLLSAAAISGLIEGAPMRINVRATEDAIIRLLRDGHPLPGDLVKREEETRLPVFQNVGAHPVKDFGIACTSRIVLARGRKDVWFVDIRRRGGKVTMKETTDFIERRDQLQSQYKGQKVTGWLITTSDIDGKAHDFINEKECFATACAAKR